MMKCNACGEPIRRGYPMVTKKGEDVIICERCKRLWKKLKAEEEKLKGADDLDKTHEVVVNGNCAICGKPLSRDRVFVCEECNDR